MQIYIFSLPSLTRHYRECTMYLTILKKILISSQKKKKEERNMHIMEINEEGYMRE